VIRLAAVGDLHAGADSVGAIGPAFRGLEGEADALLLAGDLTKSGLSEEAAVLADELAGVPVPIVAVLGNHDHHSDRGEAVRTRIAQAGVTVLEAERTILELGDVRVGIVGAKGFGGGFEGASGTEFGEPEMKAFVRHTRERAEAVEAQLDAVEADLLVLLLHYAPIRDTLAGEPPEIFPFLGSYVFAEVADRTGVDLIVHGHAHRGAERGTTRGGIGVRNVALPVLRRPYAVYAFDGPPAGAGRPLVDANQRSAEV
jgi:Icc-related predicted phosphoesterase